MVFFVRPTKGFSPNIPGPGKSPANRIYYTVGLARMGKSPIWAFQCAAELQRYMENCLTGVRDKFAFLYLDDVLVYSDDFDPHVDHYVKCFKY